MHTWTSCNPRDLHEDSCHDFDLQMAFVTKPTSSTSSFSAYCAELQQLQLMKACYAEVRDELATLEELLTYVAVLGENASIARHDETS